MVYPEGPDEERRTDPEGILVEEFVLAEETLRSYFDDGEPLVTAPLRLSTGRVTAGFHETWQI